MLLGVPIENIVILLLATAGGFAAHVLMKIGEIRAKDDAGLTGWEYFAQRPYKTGGKALLVFGAALGLAQVDMTWQVVSLAVGIGYFADSAPNHFKR